MIGVCLRARLAGVGGRIVGERDAEAAALSALELVHLAGHPGGHHPGLDGLRVEERRVDSAAWRMDATGDAGRAHATKLSEPALASQDGQNAMLAIPATAPQP